MFNKILSEINLRKKIILIFVTLAIPLSILIGLSFWILVAKFDNHLDKSGSNSLLNVVNISKYLLEKDINTTLTTKINDDFAGKIKDLTGTDTVFIQDNRVVSTSFTNEGNKSYKDITPSEYFTQKHFSNFDIYESEIKLHNGKLLKTAVLIDNSEVTNTVFKTISIILMILLATLIVTGLLVRKISRNITKSADLILFSTEKVAHKDFNVKIQLETKDEFGRIANHFNIMAERIKENFEHIKSQNLKIKQHSAELEERVKERTAELEEKNRILTKNEEALINFTEQLNEQAMEIGVMKKALEDKEEALVNFTEQLNEQAMEMGKIKHELEEKNKKLEDNEASLIKFMEYLNEQTMAVGKIEKELELKNTNLEESNEKLYRKERALLKFTKDLNEQTMTVGQIEQELRNKSDELENLNNRLNEINATLKNRNRELLMELEMARRVQINIIPDEKSFPKVPELTFASRYLSMESIGGDIYDVIKISDVLYGFLMVDVSGHGVPSALITTMAKVSFNSNSIEGLSTREICQSVNEEFMKLIGDLPYFITAYFCILNIETGELEFTNGGHHPAILYRKSTSEIEKLDSDGTVLGAFYFKVEYGSGKTIMDEGDSLLLFTDGILEAKNEDKELYGRKRLSHIVKEKGHLEPNEFLNDLIQDLYAFCVNRPQDDDRALLYIKFNKKRNKKDEKKKDKQKN